MRQYFCVYYLLLLLHVHKKKKTPCVCIVNPYEYPTEDNHLRSSIQLIALVCVCVYVFIVFKRFFLFLGTLLPTLKVE